MRIVLDTNVLVRANPLARPQGLERELLLNIVTDSVPVLSASLLVEVRRVLAYPRVQAKWALSEEIIEQYLYYLEAAGEMIEMPDSTIEVVSDPDDDPILQTAITGRADVLCTRDVAFRHPKVDAVCRQYPIRMLDDIALMKELRRDR